MDLWIPPLKLKNLLERDPLESRFLVRGLAEWVCKRVGEGVHTTMLYFV